MEQVAISMIIVLPAKKKNVTVVGIFNPLNNPPSGKEENGKELNRIYRMEQSYKENVTIKLQ